MKCELPRESLDLIRKWKKSWDGNNLVDPGSTYKTKAINMKRCRIKYNQH